MIMTSILYHNSYVLFAGPFQRRGDYLRRSCIDDKIEVFSNGASFAACIRITPDACAVGKDWWARVICQGGIGDAD